MFHKLEISDGLLKQAKRWSHQVERLDKVWKCVAAGDGPDKGLRMSRVLKIQDNKRARMGITLEVMLIGVEG